MMRGAGLVMVVDEAWYTSARLAPDAPLTEVLRLEGEEGAVVDVPNGDWTADNPALAVLAYLNASPSQLDDVSGGHLPVAYDGDGDLRPSDLVVARGKEILSHTEWFVPVAEAASDPTSERRAADDGGGGPAA